VLVSGGWPLLKSGSLLQQPSAPTWLFQPVLMQHRHGLQPSGSPLYLLPFPVLQSWIGLPTLGVPSQHVLGSAHALMSNCALQLL
jgi:hypothetical protein